MKSAEAQHRPRGFTLLEMMLSVAVFILLVTSAFSLVGATSELMAEISEVQNRSALRLRFVETCRVAFESMNQASSLEFHWADSGRGAANTYLSLVGAPAAFDFGVNLRDEIERVVIAAEIRPDGFIRSRVYYMTTADFEEARTSDFTEIRSPYLDLVPRMRQLSWFFYDARTGNWEPNLEGEFPTSLVKLVIQNEGDVTPLQSVFYFVNEG